MTEKKLYRSRTDRVVAGVCGGLGEYLGVDATLIRFIFLLMIFGGGAGLFIYFVAWLIIPEAPVAGKTQSEQGAEEQIKKAANEIKEAFERTGAHRQPDRTAGMFLLIIGLFFLLNNLVPHLFSLSLFWPLVLIALGLVILGGGKGKE